MSIKTNSLTIEYQVHKDVCHCCYQKLPEPQISELRKFNFSKDNLMKWVDWADVIEYEEDLNQMVEEFVYDTIHFFAESIENKLIINSSEIAKMKQFVLNSVSA